MQINANLDSLTAHRSPLTAHRSPLTAQRGYARSGAEQDVHVQRLARDCASTRRAMTLPDKRLARA
jgi:hypothetical protein